MTYILTIPLRKPAWLASINTNSLSVFESGNFRNQCHDVFVVLWHGIYIVTGLRLVFVFVFITENSEFMVSSDGKVLD
jgi:hypothetical protein